MPGIISSLIRRYGTPPTPSQKEAFVTSQQKQLRKQITTYSARSTAKPKSVIIIGAGFAGLSAGYYLTQQQQQVTIFEASDRIGGRVFSNRDDFAKGQIVEFGGELIGSNHPHWVDLAREFGLSFNMVTTEDKFDGEKLCLPLLINGKQLSKDEAKKLSKNMDKVLDELNKAAKVLNRRRWENPWKIGGAKMLDNISLEAWYTNVVNNLNLPANEKGLLLASLDIEFANNNAVPCNKQSLLAVLAQIQAGGGKLYWTQTEIYRCSSGNHALAERLAGVIQPENIHLNAAVKRIELKDDGVIVYDVNGNQANADYVILATAPTTWGAIEMDAEIMKRVSQTGDALKYMSVVKDRFWIKDGVAPTGSANTIGMTWEGTDNQNELPGKTFDLTCFAGGPYADKIMETASKQINHFFHPELNKIFEGYSASFIDSHYQCWPKVENIKTGYSFPGLNQVCNQIKLLNEPYKKRMYFAGEHTSCGFWGYMEGALSSGWLTAKRIERLP